MLRSRKDHPSVGVSMAFYITCFPTLRNKIRNDTKRERTKPGLFTLMYLFWVLSSSSLKINSFFLWTATQGIMETNLDISVIQRTYKTNTEKAVLHALGWTIFKQYSCWFPDTIPIMFFQIDINILHSREYSLWSFFFIIITIIICFYIK